MSSLAAARLSACTAAGLREGCYARSGGGNLGVTTGCGQRAEETAGGAEERLELRVRRRSALSNRNERPLNAPTQPLFVKFAAADVFSPPPSPSHVVGFYCCRKHLRSAGFPNCFFLFFFYISFDITGFPFPIVTDGPHPPTYTNVCARDHIDIIYES